MQNQSDEDLDKLFKRAAEQQQTQFDPADWDNMASRLDANNKPWLSYYTWIGGLVLLGVVIWLGWFMQQSTTGVVSEEGASISQKQDAGIQGKSSEDVSGASLDGSRSPLLTEITSSSSDRHTSVSSARKDAMYKAEPIKQKNSRAGSNDVKLHDNEHATTTTSSNLVGSATSSVQSNQIELTKSYSEGKMKDSHAPLNGHPSLNLKSDSNANQHQSKSSGDANPTIIVAFESKESDGIVPQARDEVNAMSGQNNNDQQLPSDDRMIAEADVDSVDKVTSVEKELIDQNASSEQHEVTSEQAPFSKLVIKITAAPDLSSEQFKSTDKMGVNFGLMVEYFLNKNISVATGALWSRKYYSAKEVDYNGYHADRAYGDCRMWDIPLNVNYYFSPSKSLSFFASAGLSSYLMNEENYDYEVDTHYGIKTYHSQVLKENQEWFKILNVSVGLQKQINSRFAFQAEPFVKIPLAGVGEGNISLASFGAFFSVKCNLLTPKK